MLAKLLCFNFIFLSILQIAALFYFGVPGAANFFGSVPRGNRTIGLRSNDTDGCSYSAYMYTNGISDDYLDCFINVNHGAYKVCTATQKVSVSSSIMFLMVQLFISRIIFPGVSNFLNASVWSPPLHAPDDSPFDGCF